MKFELIIENAKLGLSITQPDRKKIEVLSISRNERTSRSYLELLTKKKKNKLLSIHHKTKNQFYLYSITASKSLGHSFAAIKYLSQLDISIHVKNITVMSVGRHHSNWNVIVIFSDTKLSIGESWNNIVDQRSKSWILVLVRSRTWTTDWKLGHIERMSTCILDWETRELSLTNSVEQVLLFDAASLRKMSSQKERTFDPDLMRSKSLVKESSFELRLTLFRVLFLCELSILFFFFFNSIQRK